MERRIAGWRWRSRQRREERCTRVINEDIASIIANGLRHPSACLWLTYSCCRFIGIARSHKSTHSPCQQRCQCCPHWSRRQLQHFSYCRHSFHSTMRLPGEAQLYKSLAFQSLQHVAWPNPVSMASPHKPPQSPHNLPLFNSLTSFRVRRQGPKSGYNCLVQAGRSQTSRWTCSWCPQPVGKRATSRLPP